MEEQEVVKERFVIHVLEKETVRKKINRIRATVDENVTAATFGLQHVLLLLVSTGTSCHSVILQCTKYEMEKVFAALTPSSCWS